MDDVVTVLNRNMVYEEFDMRLEEDERIKRDPMGDWQSPSDSSRFYNLHKELEDKKLRYNISKASAREKERELLLKRKAEIEGLLKRMDRDNTMVCVKRTMGQYIYGLITGKPSSYDLEKERLKNVEEYKQSLQRVLALIIRQLPYYVTN